MPSGWDCSGFVNYVLGHTFGFKLPGGFVWSGRGHGPTAAMYKVWSKASNTSTPEAGTLCVWLTHIGIAINSHQMISALDPAMGTAITEIANSGPPGEKLTLRDINTVALSGAGPLPQPGAGCTVGLIALPYYITKGVLLRARSARTSRTDPGD
jgi:hypothetical protein